MDADYGYVWQTVIFLYIMAEREIKKKSLKLKVSGNWLTIKADDVGQTAKEHSPAAEGKEIVLADFLTLTPSLPLY